VTAGLVLVSLSDSALSGVVPVSLASIGRLFHVTAGSLTWVITVQLVAAGVCTPVFSRLGDVRGHRRVLRAAALIIATGGVLIAVAPNFGLLLTGRALQGPAGAIMPLAIGVLREQASGSRLRRGIAAVVMGAAVGFALGLLAAAEFYRATGSVRDLLWVPAGCSAVAAAAAFTFVPETRWRARLRMDWLGALTLSSGLGLLLLALAAGPSWGWASGRTAGAYALSLVLLGLWAAVELRVSDPLIDLRAMSRRALAPLYLASLPMGAAFYGATTATVTFLAASRKTTGYGFGLDITGIAYLGLMTTSALVVGAMIAPRLVKYIGHQPAVYAGCAAMFAGYTGLAVWHSALWQTVVALCVSSLGIGLTVSAMPMVITERTDPASTSISTGMQTTATAIGGGMAGAGFGVLLNLAISAGTGVPREWAYVAVWLSCGLASLLALLIVAASRPTAAGPLSEATPSGGCCPGGEGAS
jgi:MFS family permease